MTSAQIAFNAFVAGVCFIGCLYEIAEKRKRFAFVAGLFAIANAAFVIFGLWGNAP